ncbi:MAG: flagellar hook-basal body complex protein FliE [Planctomycetota bacterium]|nr:flagellar hook-basal body complex protein FliE [Planctomycetota bacterium]
MSAISGISSPSIWPTPSGVSAKPAEGGPSFQSMLQNSIEQTSQSEAYANQMVEQSLLGDDVTQVEVMTAVKKADLALKMMVQVRNKLLEAYDEIKQLRM